MPIDSLKWIGHASFVLEGDGKTAYIDPFKLDGNYGRADAVFITHPHFDHFSLDDISKIAGKSTVIVAPKECEEKLDYENVKAVKPNEKGKASGISFRTVHAYNTDKDFHKKESGWVGYIIDFAKTSFYHAGDTDRIGEMKNIEADVALLPIGGTYTMNVEEAIDASSMIKAGTYVPMHYKMLLKEDGSRDAEAKFGSKVKGSKLLKEVQKPLYSFD